LLARGSISLPPLRFRLEKSRSSGPDSGVDAIVKADWGGQPLTFAAQIKRYSSDQSVFQASRESRFAAEKLSILPLVITPWLSDEQLENLESQGVSGIDLCG